MVSIHKAERRIEGFVSYADPYKAAQLKYI